MKNVQDETNIRRAVVKLVENIAKGLRQSGNATAFADELDEYKDEMAGFVMQNASNDGSTSNTGTPSFDELPDSHPLKRGTAPATEPAPPPALEELTDDDLDSHPNITDERR